MPSAILLSFCLRSCSYSNFSWRSKSLYSKLFLSMYIIHKNYACYCVTHFLIGLGPSVHLFGANLSEGCCVVSNHFSIYSHTVMHKHHWSQYWLLGHLSPNFIITLFKWHGSVFMGSLLSPRSSISSSGIPVRCLASFLTCSITSPNIPSAS